MTFIPVLGLSAMILCACFSENAVEDEIDGAAAMLASDEEKAQAETEAQEATSDSGKMISPLPFTIDMNNPEDFTLPASFNSNDINTESGELTFTIYSQDLYDAVDINMMQQGDTLYYDGGEIVVDVIESRDGTLLVNGGYEEGGCNLVGYEGGTYTAVQANDYPTFSEIGTLTLPLSDSITISDASNDPNSPKTAELDDIDDYKSDLADWQLNYNCLNTTVEVSNGKIVSIKRIWIP